MRRLKIALFSFLLLIFFLVLFFFLFKSKIISYLSVNKPVDADYLLVEGWISENSLENAAKEFQTNNYKKLLVTGIPIESWYFIPDDGFFIFNFKQDSINLLKGDSIKIDLKGTQALGDYAHFSLYVNDRKVGNGFSTEDWKEHLYISDSSLTLKTLTISFDNNDYYGKEDRNLFIGSVRIKNQSYKARSKRTILYHQWDPERRNPIQTNFQSVAAIAAYHLQSYEIPGDKIITLPAEDSRKNRTLNSAISVSKWISDTAGTNISLNIYSENIHSRRSWLVYKMALDLDKDKIGVIPGNLKNDDLQNNKINNLTILRELLGIFYYSIYYRIITINNS